MKKIRLIAVILCIAIVLASCAACNDEKKDEKPAGTSVPAAQSTEVPTDEPGDDTATEIPTEEPTEAPTAEPTAEPTAAPADGTQDLTYLFEDSFGSIDYDSTSVTIDVTSSYGDMAVFSLDNSDDFTFSFRIADYLPTENHQQVGIIIAPDVHNLGVYGKFMRTFSGSNVVESYGTEGTSWATPDGSGQTPDPFTDSDSIYMKVERHGAKISFFVSSDGAEWTALHEHDCQFDEDLQIAFTGATFTSAEAHAVFDNIKLIYG